MAKFRGNKSAFGAPGDEPRWTHGNKEGVGTSFFPSGRIWFTLWRGILTEVYYPTIDRPQLRDLQFLFTDGESTFLEEKRDLDHKTGVLDETQGYRIQRRDPGDRFSLIKEVIADPDRPCILLHSKITGDGEFVRKLKTYVLCAPHLENGGAGNSGYVVEVAGRWLLVAEKAGRWMALGASCPFSRLSCGYTGSSDGYTDLAQNCRMDYEFDEARNGNIALTGELDLSGGREFTVGIAFGEDLSSAVSALFQSLGVSFEVQQRRFREQWKSAGAGRHPLTSKSGDQGRLFRASHNILVSHEDKTYHGALIASLAIPWGEVRDDRSGRGGYHLVWTRDLVQSAMALLAAGDCERALRALIYLAARQNDDGSFAQNFWVNGTPFRQGMQLDEVAFPVLLVRRLYALEKLGNFDPRVLVKRAMGFLIDRGPVTGEERWEEASGYSPSTLAVVIAASVCAAAFSREDGDEVTAQFLESYADYLRAHLNEWTVTNQGALVPEVTRHFIRLNPVSPGQVAAPDAVDRAELFLTSQKPGAPASWPVRNIVDAGFLQLTRYGILRPDAPLILDSLRVIDAVLKLDSPFGPVWRRYNHDGYGERPDGSPYAGWGQGRAWPLLTGERGHYELAAGHYARTCLTTLERLASGTGLLPEQVWDEPDLPEANLFFCRATGSAMPLLWAHAEYIRLLRSCHDGKVFDLIPEVRDRYLGDGASTSTVEFWLHRHPIASMAQGHTLRVCARGPFRLRFSHDGWTTHHDADSTATGIGSFFADIASAGVPSASSPNAPVEFTFFWLDSQRWEDRNYQVKLV